MSAKHTVTIVVWADAVGGVKQGWRPLQQAVIESGVVHCVASGHVIKETKKYLTLAPHCAVEGGEVTQVDGELTIPRGWILYRKTVEIPLPAEEAEG